MAAPDQISPLPALTQDEIRVGAWAEVREPLELQLAPLGRRALAALAPHPGESVLDIGCGGGETALDLAPGSRAGRHSRGGRSVGCGAGVRAARGQRVRARAVRPSRCPGVPIRTGLVRRRLLAVWGDVLR